MSSIIRSATSFASVPTDDDQESLADHGTFVSILAHSSAIFSAHAPYVPCEPGCYVTASVLHLLRMAPTFSLTPSIRFCGPELSAEEIKRVLMDLSVVRVVGLDRHATADMGRFLVAQLPFLNNVALKTGDDMPEADAVLFLTELLFHQNEQLRGNSAGLVANLCSHPPFRRCCAMSPIGPRLVALALGEQQESTTSSTAGMDDTQHGPLAFYLDAVQGLLPDNLRDDDDDDDEGATRMIATDAGKGLAGRIAAGTQPPLELLAPLARACVQGGGPQHFLGHECHLVRVAACELVGRLIYCYGGDAVDLLYDIKVHEELLDLVLDRDLAAPHALEALEMFAGVAGFRAAPSQQQQQQPAGAGAVDNRGSTVSARSAIDWLLGAGLLRGCINIVNAGGALSLNRIECPVHRPRYVPIPPRDLQPPQHPPLRVFESKNADALFQIMTALDDATPEVASMLLNGAQRGMQAAARGSDGQEEEQSIFNTLMAVTQLSSRSAANGRFFDDYDDAKVYGGKRPTHHSGPTDCNCCRRAAETRGRAMTLFLLLANAVPELWLDSIRRRRKKEELNSNNNKEGDVSLCDAFDFCIARANDATLRMEERAEPVLVLDVLLHHCCKELERKLGELGATVALSEEHSDEMTALAAKAKSDLALLLFAGGTPGGEPSPVLQLLCGYITGFSDEVPLLQEHQMARSAVCAVMVRLGILLRHSLIIEASLQSTNDNNKKKKKKKESKKSRRRQRAGDDDDRDADWDCSMLPQLRRLAEFGAARAKLALWKGRYSQSSIGGVDGFGAGSIVVNLLTSLEEMEASGL